MEKRVVLAKSLDFIERIGNKLPEPTTIFIFLIFTVISASWFFAKLGVTAINPVDGQTVIVQSLLTDEYIRRMFTDMIKNFASFPPLGLVLTALIGMGVAEKSGLVTSALKRIVTIVPNYLLPATLVFAGINADIAADAGYVVLTPLGAILFMAFGRHPIAGLSAVFAGVSAGFSANILITSLDPLLSGLSTKAAQLVDPSYVVQATSNYYFMFVSTFVLTIVGTLVVTKIVEPRLGPWKGQGSSEDASLAFVGDIEKKGLRVAGLVFFICSALIIYLGLGENAILKDAQHGSKAFFDSIVPLIMLTFLFSGIAFGIVVGTIKSDKDVLRMVAETLNTMGAYIVLAFFASQFIAYFAWSNMGIVTAINGASALKAVGLTGIPLIISFILVTIICDLFIGSASAKWAIMAPVFVPMFMILGYSPELTQNAYRIGDSVVNVISPLMSYFPIIIAFTRKYDKDAGLGTIISIMLPYSIAFFIFWTILMIIWMVFDLPLGPGVLMNYTP